MAAIPESAKAFMPGLIGRVRQRRKSIAFAEGADKRVPEACRIVKERAPGLVVDGEPQADAAVSPEAGQSKAPGSKAAGRANTPVFPDLAPANDLSRGCPTEDICNVAVAAALQSETV
jgi:phosphate acetyltransferase